MKTLLMLAALGAAASIARGQGYVSFANTSGTRFSTNRPGDAPGTGYLPAALAPAGSYYFELFAAPSTQNTISTLNDPTLNGWTAVALGTNTTVVGFSGRLSGNNFDSAQAVSISGFAAGSTADFAVAGWTYAIGSTWAQAQAWWNNGTANGPQSYGTLAWFGINPTVADDVPLTAAFTPYNSVFGSSAGLLNGWGLSTWIPEPSSVTLTGLGAAIVSFSRRRK